jgi:hypothetical protein
MKDAETIVKVATAAPDGSGYPTHTRTGGMLKTRTSAHSASGILDLLPIWLRYVLMIRGSRSEVVNSYQHKLSHRTRDYGCLMCDQKFKTYGGMVCISNPVSHQDSQAEFLRSFISNLAAAAT